MKKPLGIAAIALMNVAIVASLQIMTTTAPYGLALIPLYFIASLTFFIPCLVLIQHLSTTYPVTGGAYIWVEKAFGKKWGFFAVCIQWVSNLIWYPTIFSFIASTFAYLFQPSLADSKSYMFFCLLFFFWGITYLNTRGIKISSNVSSACALLGILLPTLVLIFMALTWLIEKKTFVVTPFWPDLTHTNQWSFLTQIIVSLIGIEMAAVHMGDVRDPGRVMPKAMKYSAALILFIVIAAPLSISMIIPAHELSIVSGFLDALKAFFSRFHFSPLWFLLIIALIFLGNIGSVTAWMISSTRGMHVASIACHLPHFFQKTNRYHAPVGVLIIEAIIFTAISTIFIFSSTISNAYWILLELASQVSLLYYLLIFAAAISLKHNLKGFWKTAILSALAGASVIVAIIFGFFPPSEGSVQEGSNYPWVMGVGIILSLLVPVLLLRGAKYASHKRTSD